MNPSSIVVNQSLMQKIWEDFKKLQAYKLSDSNPDFSIPMNLNFEILAIAEQDILDATVSNLGIRCGVAGRFLFEENPLNVDLYILRLLPRQVTSAVLRGSTRVHILLDARTWNILNDDEVRVLHNSLLTASKILKCSPDDLIHILEQP